METETVLAIHDFARVKTVLEYSENRKGKEIVRVWERIGKFLGDKKYTGP